MLQWLPLANAALDFQSATNSALPDTFELLFLIKQKKSQRAWSLVYDKLTIHDIQQCLVA